MSKNREGYRFAIETKEKRFIFQKGRCAETGEAGRLQAHHKIPIWFARAFLQPTEEVKEYIRGEGNLIYLVPEAHTEADKFAEENTDFLKEVAVEALGEECLLEKGRSCLPKETRTSHTIFEDGKDTKSLSTKPDVEDTNVTNMKIETARNTIKKIGTEQEPYLTREQQAALRPRLFKPTGIFRDIKQQKENSFSKMQEEKQRKIETVGQ